MDGSSPSGFIESEWRSGEEHPMPNDPLRCFYYTEHAGAFKSCEEYGYTYDPTKDVDDQGETEEEDDYNWDEEDWTDDDSWFEDWCGGEDWCKDWFTEDDENQDDGDYPCTGLQYDHTAY